LDKQADSPSRKDLPGVSFGQITGRVQLNRPKNIQKPENPVDQYL
jgi:hypothetical protein